MSMDLGYKKVPKELSITSYKHLKLTMGLLKIRLETATSVDMGWLPIDNLQSGAIFKLHP